MARVQAPPILAQIRAAKTPAQQATALRALRDDIIGHSQRKEQWVRDGILEPLVKTLVENAPLQKRPSGGSQVEVDPATGLGEEETVRLLSLQLLASFTYSQWIVGFQDVAQELGC